MMRDVNLFVLDQKSTYTTYYVGFICVQNSVAMVHLAQVNAMLAASFKAGWKGGAATNAAEMQDQTSYQDRKNISWQTMTNEFL